MRSAVPWVGFSMPAMASVSWCGRHAFRGHVPEAEVEGDVIAAYSRRMKRPDRAVRLAGARARCGWKDAVLSLEPNARLNVHGGQPEDDILSFVRICTHYPLHAAWLEEGAPIPDARRLASIPRVLIHGRCTMSCPIDTASAPSRAWPGAELLAVEDAGHLRSDMKRRALLGRATGVQCDGNGRWAKSLFHSDGRVAPCTLPLLNGSIVGGRTVLATAVVRCSSPHVPAALRDASAGSDDLPWMEPA